MMTMTAVSRVRAAQPDAFWLACERGYDTLFVHDAVRQEKCLALQEKCFCMMLNSLLSELADDDDVDDDDNESCFPSQCCTV